MISKKKLLLMTLMVMSLGVTSASLAAAPTAAAKSTPASAYTQGVPSAKEKSNPFGLVYDGAITRNVKGQVNIRPVHYDLNGITVAANVYLPADYDEKSPKLYPAITVAHPNGGDKEQVAGLFAQKLAEAVYHHRGRRQLSGCQHGYATPARLPFQPDQRHQRYGGLSGNDAESRP